MLINQLKTEKDKFVFQGEEVRVYIPDFYFESGLAEVIGARTNTLGLLNCQLFDKGKPGKIETINLPTQINIYPSEVEKQTLTLIKGGEPEVYHVAKFYRGDSLTDTNVVKDSTNVEKFLKVLTGGKVPSTVPYGKVIEIWHKNLEINGIKLGVSSTVMESIIRESYRDKSKPEFTFGEVASKNPNKSEFDYRTANIREVCALNSVFAGITFENMDQMINSGINITRYKKKQTISPVEKIIKM